MNVYVFNPEHDIALAANSRFWTAPHAGRQLRSDLGWLPVLWADDGDVVVVNDVAHAENCARKLNRALPCVRFVQLSALHQIEGIQDARIQPWGWDVSIREQLRRAGIANSLMPKDEQLTRQRELSDRATAACLLKDVCKVMKGCIGEARVLTGIDDIEPLKAEWGRVVLKAPWSSSGRGVRYVDDRPCNLIRWAEKVLKSQGHLMAERWLDKVEDFGMEFFAHEDGRVTYEGLSLFDTSNGAYTGSVLATEDEKMEQITRFVPESLLLDIQGYICKWMEERINGVYEGPFGVDMMVCRTEDNALALDPCVEINLRRTMGHVALAVSPRQAGMQQIMRVGYEGTSYHFRISNDHEILI